MAKTPTENSMKTRGVRLALSPATRETLGTLGAELKAARLERRMLQKDLASRLGVSRYTVMALERGDPSVAVGTVLEAAAVLGIPLIADDSRTLAVEAQRTKTLLRFLPARVRRQSGRVNDDF